MNAYNRHILYLLTALILSMLLLHGCNTDSEVPEEPTYKHTIRGIDSSPEGAVIYAKVKGEDYNVKLVANKSVGISAVKDKKYEVFIIVNQEAATVYMEAQKINHEKIIMDNVLVKDATTIEFNLTRLEKKSTIIGYLRITPPHSGTHIYDPPATGAIVKRKVLDIPEFNYVGFTDSTITDNEGKFQFTFICPYVDIENSTEVHDLAAYFSFKPGPQTPPFVPDSVYVPVLAPGLDEYELFTSIGYFNVIDSSFFTVTEEN